MKRGLIMLIIISILSFFYTTQARAEVILQPRGTRAEEVAEEVSKRRFNVSTDLEVNMSSVQRVGNWFTLVVIICDHSTGRLISYALWDVSNNNINAYVSAIVNMIKGASNE